MKREPILWGNIFANDTSDKGLISKVSFIFFNFHFLLNLLGWHWLIKLCMFQVYNYTWIICILYFVFTALSQVSFHHYLSSLYPLLPSLILAFLLSVTILLPVTTGVFLLFLFLTFHPSHPAPNSLPSDKVSSFRKVYSVSFTPVSFFFPPKKLLVMTGGNWLSLYLQYDVSPHMCPLHFPGHLIFLLEFHSISFTYIFARSRYRVWVIWEHRVERHVQGQLPWLVLEENSERGGSREGLGCLWPCGIWCGCWKG